MWKRNTLNQGEDSNYVYQNENNVLINNLKDKVGDLKSLALDMGDEIKYQNKFLNGMSTEFDNSTNFLSKSYAKVKQIAASGYSRHILYLVLFSLLIFFMIYILIKFR